MKPHCAACESRPATHHPAQAIHIQTCAAKQAQLSSTCGSFRTTLHRSCIARVRFPQLLCCCILCLSTPRTRRRTFRTIVMKSTPPPPQLIYRHTGLSTSPASLLRGLPCHTAAHLPPVGAHVPAPAACPRQRVTRLVLPLKNP